MWCLPYVNISEIESVPDLFKVLNNPAVDDSCPTVTVNNGVRPYMLDPDCVIISNVIEMSSLDDYWVIFVAVVSHIDCVYIVDRN